MPVSGRSHLRASKRLSWHPTRTERRWLRAAVACLTSSLWATGCYDVDEARATGSGGEDATAGDESAAAESRFGPAEFYELRLNEAEPATLQLSMNRDEVAELFGDSAEEVLLLELDSKPLLTNVLEEIKNACGTAWQDGGSNTDLDCSLTPLGQTFKGPDGTWRTSPEYAVIRILTTTAGNADVTGTSSQSLASIADFFNIGGGYNQLLASALGISKSSPVVPTTELVLALQENFLATHPNMEGGSKIKVYLSDALSDLATLTERLGPAGEHPGIVDASQPMHGEIFTPEFKMNCAATSNLRLVDGIDGENGKGYMSVIADVTGPSFDDELEFDFSKPENFSLQGIAPDLTVDMRLRLYEHPEFVDSCLGPPCQSNAPGSPTNSKSVWAIDPWLIEYTVAAGARKRYSGRTFKGSYAAGFADVLIGQDGDPPGWIRYEITGGIGNPPEPQYIWETINEVAQVSMHKTEFSSFAEGTVNAAFTVEDIPVGLSGDEAATRVRPYLERQAARLSDLLLGNYKETSDRVDFYYRRELDGQLYLFFVDSSDLPEGESYGYATPGFFADSDLRTKISQRVIEGVGDEIHEKVRVDTGEAVIYYADENGTTYRLTLDRADESTVLGVDIAARIE